jgi:hypothetical protein
VGGASPPLGQWMPETAVDLPVHILSENRCGPVTSPTVARDVHLKSAFPVGKAFPARGAAIRNPHSHMDNLGERLEALEQHARRVERRLRWWCGIACSFLVASLVSLPLSPGPAQND